MSQQSKTYGNTIEQYWMNQLGQNNNNIGPSSILNCYPKWGKLNGSSVSDVTNLLSPSIKSKLQTKVTKIYLTKKLGRHANAP